MSVLTKLFGRHLWLTNTCSCGIFLGIGDLIQQTVELRRETNVCKQYNWARAGRMFLVGLSQGPPHHVWYTWLDRRLPSRSGRVVAIKILADQLFAAPFFAVTFFIGMGLLEGKRLSECLLEFKSKFPEVYLFDWCIWPPTQFLNFRYVPESLRVTYVNGVTVVWDVFLSYIKHRDQLKSTNTSSTAASEDS